jgi:hypothetical protein
MILEGKDSSLSSIENCGELIGILEVVSYVWDGWFWGLTGFVEDQWRGLNLRLFELHAQHARQYLEQWPTTSRPIGTNPVSVSVIGDLTLIENSGVQVV